MIRHISTRFGPDFRLAGLNLNNAVYFELFDTAMNGWIKTNIGSCDQPC